VRSALVVAAHPADRASGEAAFAELFPDPHAHRELLDDEGLEPGLVRELRLNDGPAALRSHVSRAGDGVEPEKALRMGFGAIAREAGPDEGRYAEIFQVVDTS
jgi:hypothetical protein